MDEWRHLALFAGATQHLKEHFNPSMIVQALIVAAITAVSTGYVSAKVMERELTYLFRELVRIDTEAKETRIKVDSIELRQARVIGQADTIHGVQDKRLERLEGKR